MSFCECIKYEAHDESTQLAREKTHNIALPVPWTQAWLMPSDDYSAVLVKFGKETGSGICDLCRNGREDYSAHFITEESIAVLGLLRSAVFIDFPKLKLVVSHGGGSVPYQVGRWVAESVHPLFSKNRPLQEHFTDSMKRLYYDSCLYHKDSIELLLRLVGSDRVLFGTEKPGSGSAPDPRTGRELDDLKPVIESIEWLTDEDRSRIFEDNARAVYTRI